MTWTKSISLIVLGYSKEDRPCYLMGREKGLPSFYLGHLSGSYTGIPFSGEGTGGSTKKFLWMVRTKADSLGEPRCKPLTPSGLGPAASGGKSRIPLESTEGEGLSVEKTSWKRNF